MSGISGNFTMSGMPGTNMSMVITGGATPKETNNNCNSNSDKICTCGTTDKKKELEAELKRIEEETIAPVIIEFDPEKKTYMVSYGNRAYLNIDGVVILRGSYTVKGKICLSSYKKITLSKDEKCVIIS